jgi:hypothetical protein
LNAGNTISRRALIGLTLCALLEAPAPGDDRAEVWLFRIESVGAANGEAPR